MADEHPKITLASPNATTPLTEFAQQVPAFIDGIKKLGTAIARSLTTLYEHVTTGELIEKAGWLPHYTSPFDQITLDDDPSAVHDLLGSHYRENWDAVKAQFLTKLATYDVDGEAKETFTEALELHELGHYRAVVRLLFPEIERVARIELYEGKLNIASLKELREAAGKNLGLSSFGSTRYSFNLYRRVSEHLYEYVTSPESIERYTNDPVPNRHASLHGVVIYKNVNNSLNAIIMAEMMLALISDLKDLISNDDAENETAEES